MSKNARRIARYHSISGFARHRLAPGFAHLFLLFIVILVAIGAIGYLAYQNAQLKNQAGETTTTPETTDEQASPTPVAPIQNEVIEENDKKVFKNNTNNYKVVIPSNWQIDDYKGIFIGIPGEVTFTHPNELSIDPSFWTNIAILATSEKTLRYSLFTQDQYVKLLNRDIETDEGQDLYKLSNIKIAGLDAVQFVSQSLGFYSIVTWLRKDDVNYYFELGGVVTKVNQYRSDYDQILSTFKFLNIPFETIIQDNYVSGHTDKKDYVIRNENDWQNLWNKIYEPINLKPKIQDINFDKEMILAVFQGTQKSTGYSINIVKIIEEESFLQVEVEETSPATDDIVGGALTEPYHVVKIKKINKEVKFLH